MKKYEYKFVEVKKQMGLAGITFEVNTPVCYQIIFEREV